MDMHADRRVTHTCMYARQPVKIQNLQLKREQDRMELALALWSEGLVSTLRKKMNKKTIVSLQGSRGDVGAGRLVNPLGLGGQLPQVKGVVETKFIRK